MPELVEAALDRSDPPDDRRAGWPSIPRGNALGPWCGYAQGRLDELADGQDRIERAVTRGGAFVRISLALIDLAKHPNAKFYVAGVVALAAIAYGATFGLSGDGFTVKPAAAQTAAQE